MLKKIKGYAEKSMPFVFGSFIVAGVTWLAAFGYKKYQEKAVA